MKTILLLLLITGGMLHAMPTDSSQKPLSLVCGAWGITGHSWGAQAGIERSRFRSKSWEVYTTTLLTFHRWPDRFTAGQLLVGAGVRRMFGSVVFGEHSVRLGYQGRIYDLDTYEINDKGEVVNMGNKWHSVLTGGASLGLGMDLSPQAGRELRPFLRGTAMMSFPNNDQLYYFPALMVEAGVVVGIGR
jgi:hypothetical protein